MRRNEGRPWNRKCRDPRATRRPLGRALRATFGGVLVLGTLGVTTVVAGALGTTWYASPAGTGTVCSEATPCSLSTALSSAGTGDTVDLAAGTYQPASGGSFAVTTSITLQPTVAGSAVTLEGNGDIVLVVDTTSGTTTVSGVTVTGGASGGGGILNAADTLTVTNSTISGNTAPGSGGGIFNDSGTLTVTNSTISGNTAAVDFGGGIANDGGTLTVTNSTISGNTAGAAGGGIFNDAGTVTLAGDIVAADGGSGGACSSPAGITDEGYNIGDDGTCGFSAANHSVSDSATLDGTLGALGDNGGTTATLLPSAGSPTARVIPANTVTSAGTLCTTGTNDQRGAGYPRPATGTTLCSIGAVEAPAGTAPTLAATGFTTFVAGTPGSFQVGTTNIPVPSESFSETGALPPGVTFSSATGSFSGTPAAGSAGTYPLTVSAANGVTPLATQAFTLNVEGNPQTVAFTSAPPDDVTVGGATYTPTATASSGLAVTITSGTPSVCALSAGVVSFSGAGTCTLQANQAGNGNYSPAATVTQSFAVASAPVPPPPTASPSLAGGAHLTALPSGTGYWVVTPTGALTTYGSAQNDGSMAGRPLNAPVVGIAATPDGKGYWLVASDGGVFSFGDASFFGSMGGQPLNQPIVGIAATPDGKGYWLVASDGGVFSFGDASFFGSMGGHPLNQPVVDLAADPSGGYWLVAADGGVFSFGGAGFFGSTGDLHLNQPVVGITATPDGAGYWLVASDGGVFNYGDAGFFGSLGGSALSSPALGLFSTHQGTGYSLVEQNGTASAFG